MGVQEKREKREEKREKREERREKREERRENLDRVAMRKQFLSLL